MQVHVARCVKHVDFNVLIFNYEVSTNKSTERNGNFNVADMTQSLDVNWNLLTLQLLWLKHIDI